MYKTLRFRSGRSTLTGFTCTATGTTTTFGAATAFQQPASAEADSTRCNDADTDFARVTKATGFAAVFFGRN